MWHGVQVVLGQVKSEDTTSRSLPVFRRIESEPTTTTEMGTPSSIGDPLLGYLTALQFTSSEVQNFLALQCLYDSWLSSPFWPFQLHGNVWASVEKKYAFVLPVATCFQGRRHSSFDLCTCYAAGSFAAADRLWLLGAFLTWIGWLRCN